MSNSKVRKMLSQLVNEEYKDYLNGEYKRTVDDINDYSDKFNDCDIECIREEKKRLIEELFNLEKEEEDIQGGKN